MATGNKRIIDIVIEVSIGVIMTAAVSVLSGIRSDLTELNIKMSTIVERVAEHENRFHETIEAIKVMDNRLRDLEISRNKTRRHGE